MKIKKITRQHNQHTYDFEVKNNHHYLMKNGVISHNTSTSIFMMAGAGFMPNYAAYFYEDNKNGKTPVSSMYLKDNPLLYDISAGDYDQTILTASVGAAQKFIDTGISSEYIINRNIDGINALYIDQLYKSAWLNDTKGVYYLRTIKKGEALVKTEDICVSCSG